MVTYWKCNGVPQEMNEELEHNWFKPDLSSFPKQQWDFQNEYHCLHYKEHQHKSRVKLQKTNTRPITFSYIICIRSCKIVDTFPWWEIIIQAECNISLGENWGKQIASDRNGQDFLHVV